MPAERPAGSRRSACVLCPAANGRAALEEARGFGAHGGQYRFRGVRAGLGAAVHVALEVDARVLAGEVEVADGLAFGASDRGPLAREVGGVRRLGERVRGPVEAGDVSVER